MNFIKRIKSILFQPNDCWKEISKEKGITNTIKYLLLLLPISALLYYIISLISLNFVKPEQINEITKITNTFGLSIQITLLIITIVLFLIFFIITFFNSALIHIFIKMFKGKGNFADTYKSFSYGSTPQFILMGIPYINQVSSLYMIYLQILGLSKLHKLNPWKAAGAIILSYILLLLIIFVPIFIFIMSKVPI